MLTFDTHPHHPIAAQLGVGVVGAEAAAPGVGALLGQESSPAAQLEVRVVDGAVAAGGLVQALGGRHRLVAADLVTVVVVSAAQRSCNGPSCW